MARGTTGEKAAAAPISQTGPAKAARGRRDEILELAAGLFAEQGIDRTTVREIGNAASILSGSLYHHFDSKETIVGEVITGYLEKRLADCQSIAIAFPDPRERLAELLRSELRDIAESNSARVVNTPSMYVLGLLPTQKKIHDLAAQVRSVWMDTIRTGVEQGIFRNDVDVEIFYALARKTTSIAQQWVDALSWPVGPKTLAAKFGLETVAEAYISTLLGGFCTSVPARPDAARRHPDR
jgi:TetR/AcrR family transcriptional regulator, cholesterol catabolism regulator